MNRTLIFVFITLFGLTSFSVSAVDVVLTMDRSLSMKGNDPDRESINGAELFSTLLDADDRLALTTFAQNSEELLPLTPLAAANTQQNLAALIEQLQMSGIRTNFEAALRVAYQIYQNQPSNSPNQRVMVLFSDGQLNLGSEEANQAAQRAIFNELIPKFQAAGIRILGVAFSPEADLDFLSQLADATGGQAFRAKKPADIYDAFIRLFEQTDQPLTAPIVNGEVKVDANVKALKLLVKRDANNKPMQLTNPSGHNLSATEQEPGVEWKRTPYFDHVTIQNPKTGIWKVTADNDNKKAYIDSDLDLQITLPTLARLSDKVIIAAKLIYRSAPINPEIVKNTHFSATIFDVSNTAVQQLELTPSSIDLSAQDQRGILNLTRPGAFEVQVTANGPDFQRQKTRFITLIGADHAGLTAIPQVTNNYTSESPNTEAASVLNPISEQATKRSALWFLILTNLAIFAVVGIGASIWWWRRQSQYIKPDDDFDDDNNK